MFPYEVHDSSYVSRHRTLRTAKAAAKRLARRRGYAIEVWRRTARGEHFILGMMYPEGMWSRV